MKKKDKTHSRLADKVWYLIIDPLLFCSPVVVVIVFATSFVFSIISIILLILFDRFDRLIPPNKYIRKGSTAVGDDGRL